MQYHKYYVTNGTDKARVYYSPNVLVKNGKKCITLYEKDYENNLGKILDGVRNDTDIMTDYFESNRYTVVEGSDEYNKLLPKIIQWGFARI